MAVAHGRQSLQGMLCRAGQDLSRGKRVLRMASAALKARHSAQHSLHSGRPLGYAPQVHGGVVSLEMIGSIPRAVALATRAVPHVGQLWASLSGFLIRALQHKVPRIM